MLAAALSYWIAYGKNAGVVAGLSCPPAINFTPSSETGSAAVEPWPGLKKKALCWGFNLGGVLADFTSPSIY